MFSVDALTVSTGDGRNFILVEPFTYTSKSGEVIAVPAGSTSDGASTPCELWPTIPPFGRYWRAAFLHDYLYRFTQRPKVECDALFKEAMVSIGVNAIEADIIYQGVNLFGESNFQADRASVSSS